MPNITESLTSNKSEVVETIARREGHKSHSKNLNNRVFKDKKEMKDFIQSQITQEDKFHVILNDKLYEINSFIALHPGGRSIVELYKNQDISEIFQQTHTGQVALTLAQPYITGEIESHINEKNENALQNPVFDQTTRVINFGDFQIDLRRGLAYQIFGKTQEQYERMINTSFTFPFYVPLFDFKPFDSLSRTPYIMIIIFWLPIMLYHIYYGVVASAIGPYDDKVNVYSKGFSLFSIPIILVLGMLCWSLAEYILHRFLFHAEKWMPDMQILRYLQFILHGIHHFMPMDPDRLVFPPVLGIFVYIAVKRFVFSGEIGNASNFFIAALIVAYLWYDSTHYYLHHSESKNRIIKSLKTGHNTHHYKDDNVNFGITNTLWDILVKTIDEKKHL